MEKAGFWAVGHGLPERGMQEINTSKPPNHMIRSDGSIGKGMSILGYLPDNDTYTYNGIGSKGRNETMIGTFRSGVFEFTSENRENGKVVKARVRMGPFTGREVPFTAETSVDGASWVMDATITYVKLD